jgi:hypothetical protein
LSPFRGALDGPDVCDALAINDFYGLGPGVYPITAVPPPSHPFCRCERVPLLRAPELAVEPKPDPARRRGARTARLYEEGRGYLPRASGGARGAPTLTTSAATRIRRELGELLDTGAHPRARAGLRAIAAAAEARGRDLRVRQG